MKFRYFSGCGGRYILTARSYDVAAALRGPDTEPYEFARRVKRIFTYAIRHYAHCTSDVCTAVPPTPEFIEETLAIAKTIRPPSWWKHWRNHVRSALIAMNHTDLHSIMECFDAAFLGPTQSHHGTDDKEAYYSIQSEGNRYTTVNLNLRLSLKSWGLGPTFYISRIGWSAHLHLLCFHIEASGWFKKR